MPENHREIVALWTRIYSQITKVIELPGTPIWRRNLLRMALSW